MTCGRSQVRILYRPPCIKTRKPLQRKGLRVSCFLRFPGLVIVWSLYEHEINFTIFHARVVSLQQRSVFQIFSVQKRRFRVAPVRIGHTPSRSKCFLYFNIFQQAAATPRALPAPLCAGTLPPSSADLHTEEKIGGWSIFCSRPGRERTQKGSFTQKTPSGTNSIRRKKKSKQLSPPAPFLLLALCVRSVLA